MLINLAQINSEGLELNLSPPGTVADKQRNVRLSAVRGLGGEVYQSADLLRLTGLHAQEVLVDALRLAFGSVLMAAGGKTELKRIACRYEQQAQNLELELSVGELVSPRLQVAIGNVLVAGHVHLENARLSVNGAQGRIEAPTARFGGLLVTLGSINLAAPTLLATDVILTWGNGFQLSAKHVLSDSADFTAQGIKARAENLQLETLQVHDADWSLGGLAATAMQVDVDLDSTRSEVSPAPVQAADSPPSSSEPSDTPPEVYEPSLPVFDWQLFDHLSGQLDVDLDVDVKLPVIQGRRAVHEFRVSLSDGLVDFRALESNLSALEDLLLDFSVRDTELVLELGVPLLPTRGRGKVLLRWPLSSQEQALASRSLVRVSRLARPSRGNPKERGASEQAEEDTGSAFELRHLAFRNIKAGLSLGRPTSPWNALLRSLKVGAISLQGEVAYHHDEQVERTTLEGTLRDLEIELDDFPVTGRRFDLNSFSVQEITRMRLELRNTTPTALKLELSNVTAKSVDIGHFAKA